MVRVEVGVVVGMGSGGGEKRWGRVGWGGEVVGGWEVWEWWGPARY